MTGRAEFEARLGACAARAGLTIEPSETQLLFTYYELLIQWNAAVNLTGLPLEGYPVPTLERLFIQPLVGAQAFPESEVAWLDIGSGGGSPAIPLKLVRPKSHLTMTEPRQRKVAFLRELIRTLDVSRVDVIAKRVEESGIPPASIDIVTVRAVRLDAPLLQVARVCLKHQGRLLSFGADPAPLLWSPEQHRVGTFRQHPSSPLDLRGLAAQFSVSDAESRRFVPLFVYDCT